MTTHLEIAAWAQREYDELGMLPTLEERRVGTREHPQEYEEAHSPWPKGIGKTVIPLHPLDHAIHDLFQSEAVGANHFFESDAWKALYETPRYWPLGWFEACDLYDKWKGKNRSNGWLHWHNPSTGERRKGPESPGEGWLRGMGPRKSPAKLWWRCLATGEVVQAEKKPGNGWVRGRQPRPRKVKWWQPELGLMEKAYECPGEGWRLYSDDSLRDGGSWFHHVETGLKVRVASCPGPQWRDGRGKGERQRARWFRVGSEESVLSAECPGKGWEKRKNPNNAGLRGKLWWHQPQTGELRASPTKPGEDWIPGMGPKKKS